jgi:hypothetical protein
MKYLKLFENFEYGSVSELEDNFIELIDAGMVIPNENGKTFDIELVRKEGGGTWVPTHYAIKVKLNIKAIKTLEDLENTKNLYDSIYQSVYRVGGDFSLSGNTLTLFIKVNENIKAFFKKWSIGKGELDVNPQPKGDYYGKVGGTPRLILPFHVSKIEDDFSVILTRLVREEKDFAEILRYLNDKLGAENIEVYGKESTNVEGVGGIWHQFYIKLNP